MRGGGRIAAAVALSLGTVKVEAGPRGEAVVSASHPALAAFRGEFRAV